MMNHLKENRVLFSDVLEKLDKEPGPFFGNKERSPLFPNLITKWSQFAVFVLVFSVIGILIFQIIVSLRDRATEPWSFEGLSLQQSKTEELPIQPFLTFVSDLKRREIFKIYQTAVKQAVPILPQVDIRQATAGLTLSGVIFEDEPQAIIEDKKKNKTYILKTGDYLENIKVESIQRGKVRLRLDSQTIDLEL